MQLGYLDREFSLQQRVAAVPDCLVRWKPVELLRSSIPKLYRSIEFPRKHRLMGQHEQIGQTFCAYRVKLSKLRTHSELTSIRTIDLEPLAWNDFIGV